MAGAILFRQQRKSEEENALATYTEQLQKIVGKYIENEFFFNRLPH